MYKVRYVLSLFVVLVVFFILQDVLVISHIPSRVIHFNSIIVDNDSTLLGSINNEEKSTSPTESYKDDLLTNLEKTNDGVNYSSPWITQGALVKILLYYLQDEDDWESKQRINHNENWYSS